MRASPAVFNEERASMNRQSILQKAVLSTDSDAIIAADKEGAIFF
jgi:hypothetical protein